jgi:hypothetical protein
VTAANFPENDPSDSLDFEANEDDVFETETKDWQGIAARLHQQNQQLLSRILKLEQTLAESQERLNSQIKKSRSAETLICQQSEELERDRERIVELENCLEIYQQNDRLRDMFVDNLSEKLANGQAQLAIVERQCALVKEDYRQQSDRLLELQKNQKELLARLYRQQRYTLQFQAALFQCLEEPNLNDLASSIPKIEPIQPWSSKGYWKHKNIIPHSFRSDNDLIPDSSPSQKRAKANNFPSPTIVAKRPLKYPKSLSAIDLPQFPKQE